MITTQALQSLLTEVKTSLADGILASQLRQEILGRKGKFTLLLKTLPEVPVAERPHLGALSNTVRQELEELLSEDKGQEVTSVDISVPGLRQFSGSIHPISAMIEEMVSIFKDLSFEVVEAEEIVSDQENFEYLNMGSDHPARDSHDSFYLNSNTLLRTHTTAAQVIEMARRVKQKELPLRVVIPGKVYRKEATDQTHSLMFHHFDAVIVDTQTTFSDLRGTLDYFAKRLFGDSVETRFRPHHFPFTEPSAELDIRWKGAQKGGGKHTEWLEMGGCGMIHPEVLKKAGINPKVYQGWAFGMSVERPIMVRSQVPDLRRFFDNSLAFLNQFSDTL